MNRKVTFEALGRVTVYHPETGEASACSPIDARERMARGWKMEAPETTIGGAKDGAPLGEGDSGDNLGAALKSMSEMTVKELREFAKEHNIPLAADVTTKAAILEAIQNAEWTLNTSA